MKKNAQMIGQVFIFILAGLVFVLILFYGYKAISGFIERGEQVQLLDFRNDLESSIEIIKRDYGSVQRAELRVPSKTEEVCLVSNELDNSQATALESAFPLFYSAWSTGSENIFLIPRQPTPILVEDIVVDNTGGFVCVSVDSGRFSLRIEGSGGKALVSEWQT